MIAAFVTLVARDGEQDNLVAELKSLAAASAGEPGTVVYAVHTSEREPGVIRIYEVYADKDAFKAHANSEAMGAFMSASGNLLAKPMEMVRCDVALAEGLPGA